MRALHFTLTAAAVAAAVADPSQSNMNVGSPYLIGNDNPAAPVKYNTAWNTKNASYFEIYAGPIETRYGEVFWQGLPQVELPDDIVKRFDGKTIAVIGYEQDQVVRRDGLPDLPVPITAAYNHHYVAWLKGKYATMVDLEGGADHTMSGHPLLMQAYAIDDPNPDSVVPSSQFFSEGNGGESRKSYHGYPRGMAQLLDSPTHFVITPMQIDTWNRNRTFNQSFVPGPESPFSQAPMTGPDAIYSGHLECPCTDRIVKSYVHQYATQVTGACPAAVTDAQLCFDGAAAVSGAGVAAAHASLADAQCDATLNTTLNGVQCSGLQRNADAKDADACRQACCDAGAAGCGVWLWGDGTGSSAQSPGCWVGPGGCQKMAPPAGPGWKGQVRTALPTRNATVSSTALPAGCSVVVANDSRTVYFNTNNASQAACGSGSDGVLRGTSESVVTFSLELDTAVPGGVATLTLTGPADVWFGVGLGAQAMADAPNAIIVLGNGTVFEQKLANQAAGARMATSVTVASSVVQSGKRTVVLTRPFAGKTADHYTFDPAAAAVPFINAIGKGAAFAYHGNKASATLHLAATGGAATCVCDAGTQGYISSDQNPEPQLFRKNCSPEPYGDLVRLHNPTCWLETYAGGLHCCKSGNILLNKGQDPWNTPDHILKYYMKWRFWYQDFDNHTDPGQPEHAWDGKTAGGPSHQNLVRFFHDGGGAGEYDVVRAPNGTAPEDTIYQITTHVQVRDAVQMCNARTSPHCAGPAKSGITLVYASGHCHAPACLKMELWNGDTGELICRQTPHFGSSAAATAAEPYDEKGYVAIPPCLYGPAGEGLLPPHYLSYDTNLTFVKWNNNTYGHYGEMDMWQMRGYQSYEPSA